MKRNTSDVAKDKMDFPSWIGSAFWITARGLVGMILSVGIFGGFASVCVLYGLERGPETVAVPNVVGCSRSEAIQGMEEVGLEIVVTREVYNADIDEGCIVETRPAAGKVTKEGRKIDAIVSLGTRTMTVPKVIGHDLKVARKRIEDAKLKLGNIVYRADSNPNNHVLEQQPAAGKVVGRNHAINLVLSGGVDYGQHELSDGRELRFRSVALTVPSGHPLQRVKVQVSATQHDFRRVFYNRVRRPGEEVKVDIYGPQGAMLKVFIDDEEVLREKL